MNIENSKPADIDEIFKLYDFASAYQRTKNVVVWPTFERSLVETELAENRQWKLIIDNSIACVWATTFSDEEIWGERNNDPSVYIHRIATNPAFRGHNFVGTIVNWAREYATKNNKKFIRLDTLGNNVKLIEHYTTAGFDFLGIHRLTNTATLPLHYQREPNCCLFEIKL
jgi:ribosomal protein S18 acetylase RimI-like enzyme